MTTKLTAVILSEYLIFFSELNRPTLSTGLS